MDVVCGADSIRPETVIKAVRGRLPSCERNAHREAYAYENECRNLYPGQFSGKNSSCKAFTTGGISLLSIRKVMLISLAP